MTAKRRSRPRYRDVSRDVVIARARALGPWYLGSGFLLAAVVAGIDWYVRDKADPIHQSLPAAILVGIAFGTFLASTRDPDLGSRPRGGFEVARVNRAPPAEAYQEALRTFGRSWQWLGPLLAALALVAAEALPTFGPVPYNGPIPLQPDSIAVCLFVGGFDLLATVAAAWGARLVWIGQTREVAPPPLDS